MDEKCTELWQKLSLALKPQVSPDTYKRWFSAVELVQADENSLTFSVPNNIYQFWIESNHMAALHTAIIAALGAPRDVKFCPPSGETPRPVDGNNVTREMPAEPLRDAKLSGSALGLNPR